MTFSSDNPTCVVMRHDCFIKIDRKDILYLLVLSTISIISHFPFVLTGFGEPDSARIAVSVIDRINHGPTGALSDLYFVDTVPLYVLCLTWLIKLLDYNYVFLPAIMNYTNAVFGTLTIIPAYLLIKGIFVKPTLAFYALLVFIFAPSFYQASIYGFPHMIAFFFFLVSLCLYLTWIDKHKLTVSKYIWLMLSSMSLMIAISFKSDIVLGSGIYIGLLYIRKVKGKKKVVLSFLSIIFALLFFLLLRQLIIGPSNGSATSVSNFLNWFKYFYNRPYTLSLFIEHQIRPVAFGAGILTSFLGIIAFLFYIFRRMTNLLVFILSWSALPTHFWLSISGNSARHTMIGVLPLIVMTIMFFYEKAPKYAVILTGVLIIGNFLITPTSSSVSTPSGRLFKSHTLLKDKIERFHTRAKAIANLKEDKIVVIGYYDNPYILYEIIGSTPSYNAIKLSGRENFKISTGYKEYIIFYTGGEDPMSYTEKVLTQYSLDGYVFVSAMYDLRWLNNRGFNTRDFRIWR